ncbi:hypothetical protein [Vibrio vulnificus]|uniref:hypothetical protein n=1 Tax=Vibrio vulnificus TaxID=672 RepID=UPI00220691DC|nr:hypothetical protein [Vibrio vulnificus]BDP31591.1 hypothetical protein VV208B2_26710 [Vibrio vulnificus]
MIYSYLIMRHPAVEYTLNSFDKVKIIKVKYGFLSILYLPLHVLSALIKDNKASFNFQYANYRYIFAIIILIILKKNYSVSLWGSDYYKCHGVRKKIIEIILQNANRVSIASRDSKRFLKKKFELVDAEVIPFLIPNLETIAQECNSNFNLDKAKKKRILCGTNGSSNQQFDLIVESLNNAKDKLANNYIIVFHLSYGLDKETKLIVDNFVNTTSIECEVVYEYFQGKALADFRGSIDILIQIQKTDQLSAAMLEHLVQNKLAITGDWLPYDDLNDIGVKYKTISKNNIVSELSSVLMCLDDFTISEFMAKNKEKIINNYGNSVLTKKWYEFLCG